MTLAYDEDEEESLPDGAGMKKFLEQSPLYAWVPLHYPPRRDQVQPDRVEVHCETCRCSRPYVHDQNQIRDLLRALDPGPVRKPPLIEDGDLLAFLYICPGFAGRLDFWVEFGVKPQRVRKVGQRPPQSIEIPKDVATALDSAEDSELLKKAKIAMGQGFGIGACAYLRRVLEHQVDPILRLVLEARENEGAPDEDLARMRKTVEGKVGDDKMKLAYQHAPRSLVVDGINPLKLLHDFLSEGIHALPEGEAAQQAERIHTALVFTVRALGRAAAERKAFAASMRGMRSTT